jgi:hypothetical protein
MNIKSKTKIFSAVLTAVAVLTVGAGSVFAANNTNLTQTINAGTLATDIRNALRAPVANPSASMSARGFSFDCETTTGTLGVDSQRIYVDNPDAADNGWSVAIAATSGATARWANGGSSAFIDFNDPSGSGCSDGGDTDNSGGQLSIDADAGTLTTDCGTCTNTGVSKGTAASFSEGVTDSVTLLSAAAGSDDIWRGYLTGVGLSQTIPAETPADSFTINLTLTTTTL